MQAFGKRDVSLRPEMELLLAAGRVGPNADQADRWRSSLSSLDWSYVLRAADWHGLRPLLLRYLQRIGGEGVPAAVLAQLQAQVRLNALRNVFLTGELRKTLQLLESAGIAAIPYKGPLLAIQAYGNLALREFRDLDLLLHRRDILRARQLLCGQGFVPTYALTDAQAESGLGFLREYGLGRDNDGVALELQWRILSGHLCFSNYFEQRWEHLEPVSLAGVSWRSFAIEDLLVILSIHGAGHCWGALRWIGDVAHLISAPRPLAWNRVLELASRLRVERMFYLGLILARDFLGAVLPDQVTAGLRYDAEVKALAVHVARHLSAEGPGWSSPLDRALFHLRSLERSRERFRYCVAHALTPTMAEWSALSLPPALFGLYPLLRMVRLGGKYAAKCWQRVRGRPKR